MNLEQVKKDRDGGVMICNDTWGKVLEACILMDAALREISAHSDETYIETVAEGALFALGEL